MLYSGGHLGGVGYVMCSSFVYFFPSFWHRGRDWSGMRCRLKPFWPSTKSKRVDLSQEEKERVLVVMTNCRVLSLAKLYSIQEIQNFFPLHSSRLMCINVIRIIVRKHESDKTSTLHWLYVLYITWEVCLFSSLISEACDS